MKKLLLLLALLPVMASAGSLTASWNNPTTNTDGTAIPATGSLSLASTKIEYFQCATPTTPFPPTPQVVSQAQPTTTKVVTGLTEGSLYCFRAAVLNVAGTQSAFSTTGSATVPVTVPGAPTLTVTVVLNFITSPALENVQLASVTVK